MTATRLVEAYETAQREFAFSMPTTATWRAYVNTQAALLDRVRHHGPIFHARNVYTEHEGRLLVLVGVRTAEEMDREAKGEER